MRAAQDDVPQRELVYRLALAIDLFGIERGSEAALNELLDANPRSAFSTHVLHNIGSRRRRWLLAYRSARATRGAVATSN